MKTFTGHWSALFWIFVLYMPQLMSPGRITPLISPSFILPFENQGQFFVFGKKHKWETAGVIFTEAPWLTAPHRNLSLSIICQTILSLQHSESALGTLLPQNKELCFCHLWVRKEKNIASLYKHANNIYIYIYIMYFSFSSKGSPFILL